MYIFHPFQILHTLMIDFPGRWQLYTHREEMIVSSGIYDVMLNTVKGEGLNLLLGQIRPFSIIQFVVELMMVGSCSDASSDWPVPWLGILDCCFEWGDQYVYSTYSLHVPFLKVASITLNYLLLQPDLYTVTGEWWNVIQGAQPDVNGE